MILKNDIIKFSVVYQVDGETITKHFDSFAAAAGCADALSGQTRFINFDATSPDGESSLHATLYIYSKVDNSRRCIHKHYAKRLAELL